MAKGFLPHYAKDSWAFYPTLLYFLEIKTKIERGTPFKRYITKAIEQTSKFTEDITKSRQKKEIMMSFKIGETAVLSMQLIISFFFCLLLVMSSVNFDVCSIAFVMYLLNSVPL